MRIIHPTTGITARDVEKAAVVPPAAVVAAVAPAEYAETAAATLAPTPPIKLVNCCCLPGLQSCFFAIELPK